MLFQIVIELLLFLIVVYYVTVIIHFAGVQMFKDPKVTVGRALIPFYCWFKKEVIR
ncbi:MAG TPA: hypothetical protein PKM40_07520 [Bacteroidia bacterium]|nr:hypothetical protein [Bacteroidia bacterium]